MIKGEDCSFTKHMRIKSRLIIRRNLSQYQSPCPSFFENQKDPFSSFHFFILNLGSSIFDLFFWLYSLFISFGFFPLPLSLSSRYSVCINRELFPLYESILFQFLPETSQEKSQIGSKIDGLM
jgi:hypothetical protein